MQKKYFDELKTLYVKFEKDYEKKIEEQRKLMVKQVKTKGKKYSVIPYREERLGNKIRGKIVDEIEMKDDNYIYYFDDEDKIRLVEEASSFLKKIDSFECYDYYNNKIYEYHGNFSSLSAIKLSLFDNGKIQEKYVIYKPEHFAYEKYVYKDNILSRLDVCVLKTGRESHEWCENFYFDNDKLKLIQRVDGIYKLNRYCDVKINYKKLDKNLETQIVEIYQALYEKTKISSILILTIHLNIDDRNPNIDLFFEIDNEEYILQEKNLNKIPLREFPLDSQEKQKILDSVLKTLVRLWDKKILEEDIYLKIIKDGNNILDDESIIPKWLKNNSQISFSKEEIRYKYIEKAEKIMSKNIKEIFEDLKKATNKKMSLENLFKIFEEMSKVSVKDISNDDMEELFLMQAETVWFNEKLMFGLSFIRQVPFEDEFLQLGMEVFFELDDKNKLVSSSWWSDEVKSDFFHL